MVAPLLAPLVFVGKAVVTAVKITAKVAVQAVKMAAKGAKMLGKVAGKVAKGVTKRLGRGVKRGAREGSRQVSREFSKQTQPSQSRFKIQNYQRREQRAAVKAAQAVQRGERQPVQHEAAPRQAAAQQHQKSPALDPRAVKAYLASQRH